MSFIQSGVTLQTGQWTNFLKEDIFEISERLIWIFFFFDFPDHYRLQLLLSLQGMMFIKIDNHCRMQNWHSNQKNIKVDTKVTPKKQIVPRCTVWDESRWIHLISCCCRTQRFGDDSLTFYPKREIMKHSWRN